MGEHVWTIWRKENSLVLSIFNPRTVQPAALPFSDWVLRINRNEQCKLCERSNRKTSSKYTGVWLNKGGKMVGKNMKGQCMYLRNTEARSLCLGIEISITYSKCCVCNLRHPACNAHAPYFVLMFDGTRFFHIITRMTRFS